MKPVVLRKYRMFLMFAMLLLLPASGMLWALANSRLLLGLAVLLSGLAVLAVIIEEIIAAAVDDELERLQGELEKQGQQIGSLNEALREEDRILMMLEEKNSRVSAELISASAHSAAA